MRVATWNVNSIVARFDRLIAWLDRYEPDVLCLQELKVVEDKFPFAALEAKGYRAAVLGQRTYNGVAILTRLDMADIRTGMDDGVDDTQARLISAQVEGARVISVYVPNGNTVGSDKYLYKLQWMERLASYLQRHHRVDEPLILCGDFNVAPTDLDVAKVEQWQDTVLTHTEVRAALQRLVEWGLVDTLRQQHPHDAMYSWWDYRMLGFPKGNGLRIDQLYASQVLAERCTKAWIDRDERKGYKPSDHAPVVAEFSTLNPSH